MVQAFFPAAEQQMQTSSYATELGANGWQYNPNDFQWKMSHLRQ